jgi:hypothetical protein
MGKVPEPRMRTHHADRWRVQLGFGVKVNNKPVPVLNDVPSHEDVRVYGSGGIAPRPGRFSQERAPVPIA